MENYYKQVHAKKIIVLHDTNGGHNPFHVAQWWMKQNKKIGTAYIIGGQGNSNDGTDYDGLMFEYFLPQYWAHHIGLKGETNYNITKASIGIELCAYGPIVKFDDTYLNTYKQKVPGTQVIPCKFRGFDYYEAYTDKQLETTKELLIELANEFNIDIRAGLQSLLKKGANAFEYQTSAVAGRPGLWTHTNYRKSDKWDCSPQPNLIEMILSL